MVNFQRGPVLKDEARDTHVEKLAVASVKHFQENLRRRQLGLPLLPLQPGCAAVISPGEWIDSEGKVRRVTVS